MQSLFLAAFVLGLVLDVVFVIRGTERWSGSDIARRLDAFGRELHLGRISLRIPVAASLLSAFGLTGYVVSRATALPWWAVVVVAGLVAGAAVAGAVLLVKRWAVPHALRENLDERFVLQGQLATVTQGIPFNGEGEIAYQIDDRRFTTRAQSVDGAPIARGVDVVIERVDSGVVFVEDWSRVEQRL